MERYRFDYPHIWIKGRLWSRRKMIVFDQFSDSNKEEMYGQFQEFLDIMEHYVEDIHTYKLIFPKAEGWGDVFMNTIKEVFDMCLDESSNLYMKSHPLLEGGGEVLSVHQNLLQILKESKGIGGEIVFKLTSVAEFHQESA